ncbi:MAG: hypothetical protein LUE95_05360, partial [Oscillospiraceae bacterium]|nr:hypothetical protein [Oscillospiraceae bacterium]
EPRPAAMTTNAAFIFDFSPYKKFCFSALWNTQMQISAKKPVVRVYHNARRLSNRTADYFRATAFIFKASPHKSAEANPCPQRQTPCSMHEQTTKKAAQLFCCTAFAKDCEMVFKIPVPL